MNLVETAKEIATKAHEGQTRWGGEPYITHPAAVAKMAINLKLSEEIQAVAWLHDVLEDTNFTTSDLINAGIPEHVISSVCMVTHREDESYLNYLLKVVKDPIAAIVKRLDLIHNLSTSKTGHKYTRDKWLMAQWILTKHGVADPEKLDNGDIKWKDI